MLEDIGHHAIDKLPIKLLSRIVKNGKTNKKLLAIGFDVHSEDFDAKRN